MFRNVCEQLGRAEHSEFHYETQIYDIYDLRRSKRKTINKQKANPKSFSRFISTRHVYPKEKNRSERDWDLFDISNPHSQNSPPLFRIRAWRRRSSPPIPSSSGFTSRKSLISCPIRLRQLVRRFRQMSGVVGSDFYRQRLLVRYTVACVWIIARICGINSKTRYLCCKSVLKCVSNLLLNFCYA